MTGRLERRLRRLEGSEPQLGGLAIVLVGEGETEEEAKQRHLEEHPNANSSGLFILLTRMVEPPGSFDSD